MSDQIENIEEIKEAEVIENNAEIPESEGEPSLLPGFKSVCARIGVIMIVVFTVRGICSILLSLLGVNSWTGFAQTAAEVVSAIIFLNFIPITAGIFILKFRDKCTLGELYAKPRYFARSFGVFPAGYGLAIACSLITTLIGMLFQDTSIAGSFDGAQSELSNMTDPASIALIVFHTVIFAPVFEEFWFRGLILHSLKPYGNGFAIFVSALLFGLTHANLGQFLYTTVVGVVLGYVAVQTGSIITTTVMHAMFNSIGCITSILLSNPEVQDYMLALGLGNAAEMTAPVVVFLVWMMIVLLFAFAGFIMAIVKLVHIKRYRVPKMQTELSTKKRWGIFLSRPTVIIMLLMAFDTMTFVFVTRKLLELFRFILFR